MYPKAQAKSGTPSHEKDRVRPVKTLNRSQFENGKNGIRIILQEMRPGDFGHVEK